jgi:chromosome partitioning protein
MPRLRLYAGAGFFIQFTIKESPMKTIVFSSIKGGTGKSSLCILTANYASAAGYHVLVADMDIQNSASSYYLDSPEEADRKNIAAVFHTERLAENIIPTNHLNIDLLASSLDLVKFRAVGDRSLKRIFEASSLPYDFLVIDTAPTYDNIVLNALNAADLIITPVAFSQFDYKGALFYEAQLQRETEKLTAWRILFNFHRPPRTENPDALLNQYEALFRDVFDDHILPNSIPATSMIRRSIDTGERITRSTCKAPLHDAISKLAAYCGIERTTERF